MVIKVFITTVSANSVLKKNQQTIIDTLTAKNIPFEQIDISSPENEDQKLFMREKSTPKDGQANAMPPQLFSDDEYLGDYDAFYDATEDNDLDVFFKLVSPTQKSEASLTVTTQPDVNKTKHDETVSGETIETTPTKESADNSEPPAVKEENMAADGSADPLGAADDGEEATAANALATEEGEIAVTDKSDGPVITEDGEKVSEETSNPEGEAP